MPLEVRPPLPPMDALSVNEIPEGKEWQYEPKWDGFRCLAFRDGSIIELQSKSEQPLARYFPELVKALSELEAQRFVLDGEIAIPEGARLFLRRVAPTHSSRGLPRETARNSNSGDLHRLRSSRRGGRQVVAVLSLEQAAKPIGAICGGIFRRRRKHPLVTSHAKARTGQKVARANRCDARRHHRQAPRS